MNLKEKARKVITLVEKLDLAAICYLVDYQADQGIGFNVNMDLGDALVVINRIAQQYHIHKGALVEALYPEHPPTDQRKGQQ